MRNRSSSLVRGLLSKPSDTSEHDADDGGAGSDSSESDIGAGIDPEDPMRDYIIAERREARLKKKSKKKSKGKHKDETPEERRVRKARKKEKKGKKFQDKSEGMRAVEELLKSLDTRRESPGRDHSRSRRRSPSQSRSRSPPRRYDSRG